MKRLMINAAILGVSLFAAAAQAGTRVEVYKSPYCGCCGGWVEHMRQAGYDVRVHDVDNVNPVKQRNGVTRDIASCHTALVDGYVIEGHVPARDVGRLLRERPLVAGLAVPRMPMGSPGMEGPRSQPYDVLTFNGHGGTTVFASYR